MADTTIRVSSETTVVRISGSVGPSGPPGSAGATYLTITAGEDLGGHRAVVLSAGQAVYADNTAAAHANRVIGITTGAATSGSGATIQSAGELTGMTGLTVDAPIYLSTAGTLTQTAPTTGFIQQLGIALSATAMLVEIQPAIILG